MLETKDTIQNFDATAIKTIVQVASSENAKDLSDAPTVRVGAKVHPAPRVSVVIPAYNIADYVCKTVESVFAQTFPAYEILLVNDGSPDTTELEAAIKPFLDCLIYIKQANGGASKARNAGIKRARGELIAFLDGDDIWLPEFLDAQIRFLESNNLDMVYSDALLFGDDADAGETYMQHSRSSGAVTTESLIAWTCNVITSGTVVRRNVLVAAGLFDESPAWMRGQDFDMWFRVARLNARIGYQQKVLLKYRVRRGSLTGDHLNQAVRNIQVLDALKNKYDLTPGEFAVWRAQKAVAEAIWETESGKAALKNNDFQAARRHFLRAAPLYSRSKIALISLGLLVAPRLVQRRIQDYNFER